MDVMVQRHCRRLLSQHQLSDLGRLSAHLDFPLVGWLARERDRVARVDDCVLALRHLHSDFSWPYPQLLLSTSMLSDHHRKSSATSGKILNCISAICIKPISGKLLATVFL